MNLCERIQVLAHGERIFEGTPAEVQAQPAGAGGLSWPCLRPMVAPGPCPSGRRAAPRGRRTCASATARSPRSRASASHVAPGEVVALLGANGAGKSTMLRTISGLIRPRSGAILFAGERIDRLPPSRIVRLGIAHCPEGRRVFGIAHASRRICGSAPPRGPTARASPRTASACYDLFPILRERMHQQAGTLSGGEQQMLALARALMARPEAPAPRRAVARPGAARSCSRSSARSPT